MSNKQVSSWEIIKDVIIRKDSRPKTMGYNIDLNKCADLFIAIKSKLADEQEALEAFNKDDELRVALLSRGNIKELTKAGVISE